MARFSPYIAATVVSALAVFGPLTANHDASAQATANAASVASVADASTPSDAGSSGVAGVVGDGTTIARVILRRKITFSVVRIKGDCLERDATYVVDFAKSAVSFTSCEPDAAGVPRWVRGTLPFQPGERDTLLDITRAMRALPPNGVQMCTADAPNYSARIYKAGGVHHYVDAMSLCDFKKPYVAATNVYEAVRDVESVVIARRFLSAPDAAAGPGDASPP